MYVPKETKARGQFHCMIEEAKLVKCISTVFQYNFLTLLFLFT